MPPERADGALRLRAEDTDDLAVISACLQDALVPVGDIAYMPEEQSFVFVANRFRWEGHPTGGTPRGQRPRGDPRSQIAWGGRRAAQPRGIPMMGAAGYERILSVVAFDAVESVLYRGFRRGERERILSLLAIRPESGRGVIHLDFSGGAGIRLAVTRILCRLKDVGLPWPTPWRPAHDLGERR
ncbi:MAG TPA: DUF2948 family protein [Stellaceae bacterium]|nr:DUF2948 family protein [Stellaceae bacterium]